MPTRYLTIQPQQEPFELPLDANGRTRWAFNFRTLKKPSSTFLEEIAAVLQAANVGTWGTTIVAGLAPTFPGTEAGPVLSIIATAGLAPVNTHNSVATPAYVQPGGQIVTRAKAPTAAETMIRAAYAALFAVRNQDITPV